MFVCHTSCGQDQTDPYKDNFNYNIKDTVTSYGPNTMVRNVKKGKNGTILIAASWSGVFRYDGKVFTNITSKIGSRRYWDVLEDRRGNLWFATTYSGVYYYDGKQFKHFTTKEGLPSDAIMCIYEDKAGIIWFGTGNGISRYDGKSFRNFTNKEGLSNIDVTTIIEDKTGKLWIGTRGDTYTYDGKKYIALANKDAKAFKNVWAITEDRKGNIWLGADALWRYDGNSFIKVSQTGASAIIEDKKGDIWTTGGVDGSTWAFFRYDQKNLYSKDPTVTEIMKRGPALFGMLEANDGIIWIGASDGVYRYDGKNFTDFKSKKAKL
jgi:ligand-binding sensor domain-containing protein